MSWEKRKREIIEFIRSKKTGTPCADCGITYPFYVMDFDHIRGKKEFNLSRAQNKMASHSRIVDEIKKCEVVCSNCHRERTWKRKHMEVI